MDYIRELDAIGKAESKAEKLKTAAEQLRFTLATLAEINDGAAVRVRLDCGHGAELNIDAALNQKALREYVKKTLEERAARQYEALQRVTDPELNRPAGARYATPEKIKTELVKEIPERFPKPIPLQQIKATTTDASGREIIDDKALAEAYFKKGLGVKAISEASGIEEDVVFAHLEKIKAAKEKAAKECARR